MENLIFSLNATIPIFLMMVLGVFFRKTGLLKENMINGLNQFVLRQRCRYCCSATWQSRILPRHGMENLWRSALW